jgi:hypothetical protein
VGREEAISRRPRNLEESVQKDEQNKPYPKQTRPKEHTTNTALAAPTTPTTRHTPAPAKPR